MSLAISNGQFQKYVKRADSEMKIAIAGTGAMGSVYAALLKDAGNEVWAVDTWQAHVEEINKNGLAR
jgi:prephenate dehydrogenase